MIDNLDTLMKAVWYNKYTFDFLTAICFGIWIVLLPLKLDNIIEWTWHYIYFPWYIFLIHFLVGISTLDLISIFYTTDDGIRTFMYKKISEGYSFMVLFTKTQNIRGIVYLSAASFLAFFLLLAEYHQNHSYPEQLIWVPMWVFLTGWFLTLCTGCGVYKSLLNCRDGWRFGLIFPYFYFVWTILFIWAKATDVATYTWPVALVPFWILFGGGLLLSITGMFFFCCDGGSEKHLVGLMSFGFIAILVPLLVWLSFIIDNLESQLLRGEITRPWVIVFIPGYIIVIEILVLCGLMTRALKHF